MQDGRSLRNLGILVAIIGAIVMVGGAASWISGAMCESSCPGDASQTASAVAGVVGAIGVVGGIVAAIATWSRDSR